MRRLCIALVAGSLVLSLLSGCSGDDDGSSSAGEVVPPVEIVASGSASMQPITQRVADDFVDGRTDVDVHVEGPGTAEGFAQFCAGETDLTNASRPIDADEAGECAAAGIEYVALPVAIDALSVITAPANEAVTCLTYEDLYALTGPEAEGFANWTQAQSLARELGSPTAFPDVPLDITAPRERSGSWAAYVELVIADIAAARLASGAITEEQAETTRPDYLASVNKRTIVESVAGSDSSLGWVTFAFADDNSDKVKSFEIDAGAGCVAPTEESILDGSYPLAQPLLLYVSVTALDEKPALRELVDFYLGDGYSLVEDADAMALPEDRKQTTDATWEGVVTTLPEPTTTPSTGG